ncbi:MAG: hypothetical protein DHS20C18_46400 [Saprospiraceae bacterium]|nr:MAG: hypothetical protein DHS20C18_46400 [Saprospiraceae bacterium]
MNLSEIDTNDYLIAVSPEGTFELGTPFAYLNRNGDTIIPMGKYGFTWTDTLKTFAIVSDSSSFHAWTAIDRSENVLFEVFQFDNGPDYLREGLFRVIRNDKIGYANKYGEIVIPCQFVCAYYFENGRAKVANDCEKIKDIEHSTWESEEWFYIDKNGRRVE